MPTRETDKYLKKIIDTMSDGLFLVGPDGAIRMVNPALERLTGFTAEELLGKPCTVFRCDVCEISRRKGGDHWCNLFDSRSEHKRRCRIMRKDGSSVPVYKNASLLMEGGKVLAAVETLSDISELEKRDATIRELSRLLDIDTGFRGMIGKSPVMLRVFDLIEKAADSDAPVIIFGESGTGKELAAHAIHALGPRVGGPFIQLNCAALNEALLESELFGHVKGAFTGAVRHRLGRFEAAHGGSLFLDEIGDVPLSTQVKLLRVLETKTVERVGDHRPITVNVRIISATNRDLSALVRQERFREDLLFRINAIPVHLPPLRARKEDIPLLVDAFIRTIRGASGKDISGLAPEALALCMAHDWPGNVRELRSALEFAFVLADKGLIRPEHLPPAVGRRDAVCEGGGLAASAWQGGGAAGGYAAGPGRLEGGMDGWRTAPHGGGALADTGGGGMYSGGVPGGHIGQRREREELLAALHQAGGNKSEAARLLGVHRGTVINRMRKHGVGLRKEVRG